MPPIRVAIAGATGRMGRMLIEAALKEEGVELAAAFDRPGAPLVGRAAHLSRYLSPECAAVSHTPRAFNWQHRNPEFTWLLAQ